jgi:DTW domain-containing protein YfiP
VPRVENRTPILILQHKHESRHPLGTVRIADLGLLNCVVRVVPGSAKSGLERPGWLPPSTGLIYPGATARDLASVPVGERPGALLMLDGTWHHARALFRDHAWLGTLPRFSLAPSEPSRYRIRREPSASHISTIEAIVQSLSILEPELGGLRGLIEAFDGLIDDQIRAMAERRREPRDRRARPLAVRNLPHALVEGFERLVITYGEAARPEHEPEAATELVHWTALRLRDGAVFDCAVRPSSGVPSAARLSHLGLSREELEGGADLEELRLRWQAFVEPSDTFASWNIRTLTLFRRCLNLPLAGFGLKGVYGRLRGVEGDLDQVLEREAASPLPVELDRALGAVRGRARLRLANAVRAALLLRGRCT